MVVKYGMSDIIGPIDLTVKDNTEINAFGEEIDNVSWFQYLFEICLR